MRKAVVSSLAACLLAVAPPSAHATTHDYVGGCGFHTLKDTTPGGTLGGQDLWIGDVYFLVTPTGATGFPDGSVHVDVACELFVNNISNGIVLTGSGEGVVGNAKEIQFTAAVTDSISLCTRVTFSSETIVRCKIAKPMSLYPDPVVEVFTLLTCPQLGPIICDGVMEQWRPFTDVVGPVDLP